MRKTSSSLIALLAATGFFGGPLSAQAPVAAPTAETPPAASLALEPGEGRMVALKLADDLVSLFVSHDAAQDYAAMLRKSTGAGAGLTRQEAVTLDAAEIPAEPIHSDKLRAR